METEATSARAAAGVASFGVIADGSALSRLWSRLMRAVFAPAANRPACGWHSDSRTFGIRIAYDSYTRVDGH
ncbi:MAG: hypothetical protein ACRETP_07355 [Steroidobacteraceae bacterium]